MIININFKDTYPPINLEDDFLTMTFESPQKDGSNQLLLVKIDHHNDPLLPNVYNLGFGPPNGQGGFLDDVRLKHVNIHRVLSTVLFHSLNFLELHTGTAMGIDGSDDLRAALYHHVFRSNRAYLGQFFTATGVDWYVRIFRDGRYEQDEYGYYIAKPRPELFDYRRTRQDLYRYYIFRLNE